MKKFELSICTTGGTLLSTLAISTSDLFRTAVFATIGAVISFLVSLLLKWLVKRINDNSG